MRLRNPNLGPNSGKRILDARILDPNSRVEFFDSVFFQQKRPPEKFTLEKFTSRNSHRKIHPRIWAEKFTLHFCMAILLILWNLFNRFRGDSVASFLPLSDFKSLAVLIGNRSGWTTGASDDGNEWRKYRVVPRTRPLRPCGLLDFQGRHGITPVVRWTLGEQLTGFYKPGLECL